MVVGTGKNLYKHIWNRVNVNVLQIKYESNIVTMCVYVFERTQTQFPVFVITE